MLHMPTCLHAPHAYMVPTCLHAYMVPACLHGAYMPTWCLHGYMVTCLHGARGPSHRLADGIRLRFGRSAFWDVALGDERLKLASAVWAGRAKVLRLL